MLFGRLDYQNKWCREIMPKGGGPSQGTEMIDVVRLNSTKP
jgi:hypothetical protein